MIYNKKYQALLCHSLQERTSYMGEILYKKACPGDGEKIVQFYNKVGGETTYLSFGKNQYPLTADQQEKSIQDLRDHTGNIMLIAWSGQEIAGIATVGSSSKEKVRHEGGLGIVVAEKFWSQGIGKELMNRLFTWASENGITTKLRLEVRTDNKKAAALYLKLGFIVEGCLKNAVRLDGVYYDLYTMGRMIEQQKGRIADGISDLQP